MKCDHTRLLTDGRSHKRISATDKMGYCRVCGEYLGIEGDIVTETVINRKSRKSDDTLWKYIEKKYNRIRNNV